MKIWQVTTNDMQLRFYWFATKREAAEYARDYRANRRAAREQEPNASLGTVEVETINIEPTREGIADALNWVITMTCFNEG